MNRPHNGRVPRAVVLLAIAGCGPVFGQVAPPAAGLRDIGDRLELFVDDWLIERMSGVELRLHAPVPREVVFRFDAPWEGPESGYVTILKDGDVYRMYYRGGGEQSRT